jgi:hypothetical protein
MEIVRAEDSREVRREVEYYNLGAVIAVGYRVNSYHSLGFVDGGPFEGLSQSSKVRSPAGPSGALGYRPGGSASAVQGRS